MLKPVTILWFRQDLRLADNPALSEALAQGHAILPLYIHSPEEEREWAPGAASLWWLGKSLDSLSHALEIAGSKLTILKGPSLEALLKIAKDSGARSVFWNRRYEPAVISRDQMIKTALRASGLQAESFNGALLHEPWEIANKSSKPFQVFTPYWKTCLQTTPPQAPLPAPARIPRPEHWPVSLPLASLRLEPRITWWKAFPETWAPGEKGAAEKLDRFAREGFSHYGENRNRPDLEGTSRLSPHLHFGEISPRQIWHAIQARAAKLGLGEASWKSSTYITELGWREFSHHLLFHFPSTPGQPLRQEFMAFPWREDSSFLKAWQKGQTGFPIVDAGMRQLWTSGWMHNRVRMITASFLVKDLLLSWEHGARWFWDTLVDADLAQNTLGWQWTAGCGADAAPYFRVFNPALQSAKFDPDGGYIRKWCPELKDLPAKWIHEPAKAPAEILRRAKVELGVTYPLPLLSHTIAREVALQAFARLKASKAPRD